MSGYIGTQPVPQATQTRDAFTCTAGQTTFATGGYTPQFLDVYLNGIKLAAADYTASNGSDVVLASGAALDDILEVVAYTSFEIANVTGADDFTVTGSFTSQGIDDNATSTAMTLDSSGSVGIGTGSPSAKLDVVGTVKATSFSGDGSSLTGISGTPAGAVIYHAGSTPPTGFIKANGASLSTTTYADLFAAIGYTYGGSGGSFNVPDLRGEFLRGWDDARGVDSGRGFGSYQADELKSHNHLAANYQTVVGWSGNSPGQVFSNNLNFNGAGSVNTGSTGGTETRPRNRALLACIKY